MIIVNGKNKRLIAKSLEKRKISIEEIKKRALDNKKVIVICGPTCTGKTSLSLNIAKILNTDIISVDSMQVFKGMDIGTDKRDTSKYGVKQYMVDIFEPDKRVTAVEFRNICRKLIDTVFLKKRRIPIIAGGSGLYIRAVIDDLEFVSGIRPGEDISIRKKLEKELKEKGAGIIYQKLKDVDPYYADKIDEHDTKRIIRALEVYNITGIAFSSFQKNWNKRKSIYNCTMIGLKRDKRNIDNCISNRVDKMLNRGLIDEVENLISRGYKTSNSLQQAVGYKEVIEYFNSDKEIKIDKIKDNIIKNTTKLAKKQMTWFKADPRINWISNDNCDSILDSIIKTLEIIYSDL